MAGKSGYKEFDGWLKTEPFPDNAIIELYRKYKAEYGVGKNFKKLFTDLPSSVKSWLSKHVIIRLAEDQGPFLLNNPDNLAILLFGFYFDIWRNPYTHSSVTRAVNTIEMIDEFKNAPEWILGSPSSFRISSKRNKSWNIYYRSHNVDLTLILRIVVYCSALQCLGIEPTELLVENYLSNLHRARLLYGTLYEYRENLEQLNIWVKIRVHVDPISSLPFMIDLVNFYTLNSIPELASTALKELLEFLDNKNESEKELSDSLSDHYLRICEFNSQIASFRIANYKKGLLSDDEKIILRNRVYTFLKSITSKRIFFQLRNYQLPAHLIALLLRDPCNKTIFPIKSLP